MAYQPIQEIHITSETALLQVYTDLLCLRP